MLPLRLRLRSGTPFRARTYHRAITSYPVYALRQDFLSQCGPVLRRLRSIPFFSRSDPVKDGGREEYLYRLAATRERGEESLMYEHVTVNVHRNVYISA